MLSQHVRRVDQLDAVSLDSELFVLLNTQYQKAFAYFPSSIVANYGPELDILFKFIFKYLPLKYLGATFGQNVFNLKFYDNKTLQPTPTSKLRLLAALSVGLPWFWDRVIKLLFLKVCRSDLSHRIFEASYSVEHHFFILWKILSLINFCVFLHKAAFPSTTERILSVRSFYTARQEIKHLQYDGISKELLWHGLSEFLGFTLPLINMFRVKNYLKRKWLSWSNKSHSSRYIMKNYNCSICDGIPNLPHTMGCSHIYCYYCIASMLLADPSFLCVHCDFTSNGLDSIKPVPLNRPNIDYVDY